MRKKLLLMLATLACIISVCCFGATTAFAGINVNNPIGEGLLSGVELNGTNFAVLEDIEDGQASAYSIQKGNTTYNFSEIAWRGVTMGPVKQIPKGDLVAGAKITMQFDLLGISPLWTASIYLSPFATHEWFGDNYFAARVNENHTHPLAGPATAEFWLPGATAKSDVAVDSGNPIENFGIQGSIITAQKAKGYEGGTYWLEYDIDTLSMTVYGGNAATGEKTQYGTMKNAFTLADTTGYFMLFGFDNNFEMDNYKLYRTVGEEVTTYCDVDFEDETKVVKGYDASKQDALMIMGGGNFKSYDSQLIVTNPVADATINTYNPLKVDAALETTLNLTASYQLKAIPATRKVGIAFGLESYTTLLSAPAGGANMLYLTVNADGEVVLGVDEIEEDGTTTAIGDTYVLAGATVGADAAYIELQVEGKGDGSIVVTVGESSYTFENVDLNGHMAITQVGTGDVTYAISTNTFAVEGYEYKGNSTEEVISATFDANYLSGTKFSYQSKVAPGEYIVKQEGTSHEIAGLVAEDGKLGFYGTSTNTRVMFNEEYADYVLQFDYISEPFANRGMPGGLTTGGVANRYSPFYVLIGAENNMPELAQTYAIGIVEGNATQYFWGAESLINFEGKFGSGNVVVTANMAEAEETAETIPCYKADADGNIGVAHHGLPAEGSLYSFYNKTTRIKLVVINNNIAFYAAEVGADGTVGEYIKIFEKSVPKVQGYVGFGTDAPGWAAIDNVAITPISKEVAIEAGLNAVPAVGLVADIAVADMENDLEPTPLAKPVLVADAEAKKVTWTAIEGAKEYEVVVKLNNEEVLTQTVTVAEIDLSSLTAYGEYDVAVSAIPENEELNLKSRGTVKYVLAEKAAEEPGNSGDETSGGCFGGMGVGSVMAAIALLGGAVIASKKRR